MLTPLQGKLDGLEKRFYNIDMRIKGRVYLRWACWNECGYWGDCTWNLASIWECAFLASFVFLARQLALLMDLRHLHVHHFPRLSWVPLVHYLINLVMRSNAGTHLLECRGLVGVRVGQVFGYWVCMEKCLHKRWHLEKQKFCGSLGHIPYIPFGLVSSR